MFKLLFAVFVGGGLGSLARYGVSKFVFHFFPVRFWVGTLAANFIACLILAWFVFQIDSRWFQEREWVRNFLVFGFCGGFSTFSTFSLESVQMIRNGMYSLAVLNILISIGICFGVLFYFGKSSS